eukprot:PhM_4_TR18502/c0_g1_i1/m.25459
MEWYVWLCSLASLALFIVGLLAAYLVRSVSLPNIVVDLHRSLLAHTDLATAATAMTTPLSVFSALSSHDTAATFVLQLHSLVGVVASLLTPQKRLLLSYGFGRRWAVFVVVLAVPTAVIGWFFDNEAASDDRDMSSDDAAKAIWVAAIAACVGSVISTVLQWVLVNSSSGDEDAYRQYVAAYSQQYDADGRVLSAAFGLSSFPKKGNGDSKADVRASPAPSVDRYYVFRLAAASGGAAVVVAVLLVLASAVLCMVSTSDYKQTHQIETYLLSWSVSLAMSWVLLDPLRAVIIRANTPVPRKELGETAVYRSQVNEFLGVVPQQQDDDSAAVDHRGALESSVERFHVEGPADVNMMQSVLDGTPHFSAHPSSVQFRTGFDLGISHAGGDAVRYPLVMGRLFQPQCVAPNLTMEADVANMPASVQWQHDHTTHFRAQTTRVLVGLPPLPRAEDRPPTPRGGNHGLWRSRYDDRGSPLNTTTQQERPLTPSATGTRAAQALSPYRAAKSSSSSTRSRTATGVGGGESGNTRTRNRAGGDRTVRIDFYAAERKRIVATPPAHTPKSTATPGTRYAALIPREDMEDQLFARHRNPKRLTPLTTISSSYHPNNNGDDGTNNNNDDGHLIDRGDPDDIRTPVPSPGPNPFSSFEPQLGDTFRSVGEDELPNWQHNPYAS